MGSTIQKIAAKKKIATTRCSISVIPSNGIQVLGSSRITTGTTLQRTSFKLLFMVPDQIRHKINTEPFINEPSKHDHSQEME